MTDKPRVSVNCWSHFHRDCIKNWCTCACHVKAKEGKR